MKKTTLASLAMVPLVVAFGLALVSPLHAQVYTQDGTGTSTGTDTTTTTPGLPNTGTSSGTGGTGGSLDTTSGGTTTPGLPSTGAGGNTAMNLALLASSGLIAIGGAVILARRYA